LFMWIIFSLISFDADWVIQKLHCSSNALLDT